LQVRIGNIEFDHVSYDHEADVLYLHVGDPAEATEFDAAAEGHALRYDGFDRLVGITILNPRLLLAEQGRVVITTPERRFEAGSEELAEAVASPAA
jgi:YD repeat-containing protein